MGVKDLWNILGPISQKAVLYDLQDKSVAVDLSCWVCEGQIIGEKSACTQPRMYLRNVFFRTHTLLMMNVKLVFVLDGEAPVVKLNAMKQRNDVRFKHYRDAKTADSDQVASSGRRRGNRSHFKGILKQCREMLELMGVPCVQSDGEAEALCAQLNREGLVDAVITQDSDVFLYGAQTVYRNLTIKAGTGTVDVYSALDVEAKLRLTRDKLVAMSVLCGCDYDQAGVHGVGKDMAYKYLSSYEGDILARLRRLRNDPELLRLDEERNGCSKCGHPGKVSEHKKEGCGRCGDQKGCRDNESSSAFKNLTDDEKKTVVLELNLRRKAILEPNFPNEDTIQEFLKNGQSSVNIDKKWKRPEISKFVMFCVKMLEWEMEYAFEKILPLYTRWVLLFVRSFDMEELVPKTVLKKRVVKGVPSCDVAWAAADENLASLLSLLPDNCSCVSDEGFCVTTEPLALISDKLPAIYEEFVERTTKAKTKVVKERKTKKKISKSEETASDVKEIIGNVPKKGSKKKEAEKAADLTDALKGLSLSEHKKSKSRKVRIPNDMDEVDNMAHSSLKSATRNENLCLNDLYENSFDYFETSQIFHNGYYGDSRNHSPDRYPSKAFAENHLPLSPNSFNMSSAPSPDFSRGINSFTNSEISTSCERLLEVTDVTPVSQCHNNSIQGKSSSTNLISNFNISFDVSNLSLIDSPVFNKLPNDTKSSQYKELSPPYSTCDDNAVCSSQSNAYNCEHFNEVVQVVRNSDISVVTINDSCDDLSESMGELDISAIVDNIVSRKRF